MIRYEEYLKIKLFNYIFILTLNLVLYQDKIYKLHILNVLFSNKIFGFLIFFKIPQQIDFLMY